MKFALIFLIGQFGFLSTANSADPTSGGIGNPTLNSKAQAVIKSALQVIKEEEGVVTLSFTGNTFTAKTQILFFRKRGSRIEMIATGVFVKEQMNAKTKKKELVAQLNRDMITKYPTVGDYAVPMTEPNTGAEDGKDGNQYPTPIEMKSTKEPNTRPGYIEYGMGMMSGTLGITPAEPANISKLSTGYRFLVSHFVYYSEYFPMGIEYDSHGGDFPTTTYQHSVVTSSETISNISINYRFKPMFNRLLAIFARVNSLSENFTTNNDDTSLLKTKTSGLGFGVRAQLDLVSPVWKPEKNDSIFQIQSFFGEFLYYPTISAVDDGISRGTSSNGSTATQIRIGATALAWFEFIPIFKRWVIQGSYGARAYSLKFSGPTVSEVGNPETIPENTTSSESEKDYRVFIGIRLEDPVKLLFFGNDP